MLAFLFLVVGLALLVTGGDALVRGAVSLAERLHVPHVIIGLTIVAIGTSAPEMFVSVDAALNGVGGIAIGNVIGSNIANILLVLGLPSMIAATKCRERGIGRNLAFMGGFTLIFMGMLAKGRLERYDGLILLALCVLFLWTQYNHAMKHRTAMLADGLKEDPTAEMRRPLLPVAAMLFYGILALPLGAELTVNGASTIASRFGISEEVIGLTIIAIGTSLPELATTMLAVWRGSGSVAIGNVVGSNIFNIAAIMGVAVAIVPIEVGARVIHTDMWVMLASAALLIALGYLHATIGRWLGLAMAGGYVIYIASAIWTN